MMDHSTFVTILAIGLAVIGLVNWQSGSRLVRTAQERAPLNPVPSLSLGHHVLVTAGMGQLIVAAAIVFMAGNPVFLTRNYPLAGVVYLVFALFRSVTMRNLSKKFSVEMAFGYCLAVNLLWPILAVLLIPISLVDLWNRRVLPEDLNTTPISGYAKET